MENSEPLENVVPNQVLLIDLENCPNQIQQLQKHLESFSKVIICYAKSDAKVPLDWLIMLNKTINENKLKIFRMPNGGKNAADFGICFFSGILMAQLPKDTRFVIVSNDADLDHVVNLLKSQGRLAERIGAVKKEEQNTLNQTIAIEITPELKKCCLYLMAQAKNRPAKKETLMNMIRVLIKGESEINQSIFDSLISYDVIKISGGKVVYNEIKIKELATGS